MKTVELFDCNVAAINMKETLVESKRQKFDI